VAAADIAQARFPPKRDGMIGRCDAVRCQLSVCVDDCGVQREENAGAGHELTLERIAMNVNYRRRQDQAARVDCVAVDRAANLYNSSIGDGDICLRRSIREIDIRAFESLCRHDQNRYFCE